MKVKTQKGITLVALIITIVVLLILAVVAITLIQNTGIISHAGNATTEYNKAVENEQAILNHYEERLEATTTPTPTVEEISFTIEGATYYATEGMTWDQWVNSSYNTIEAWVESNIIYAIDSASSTGFGELCWSACRVNASEQIDPSKGYDFEGGVIPTSRKISFTIDGSSVYTIEGYETWSEWQAYFNYGFVDSDGFLYSDSNTSETGYVMVCHPDSERG